MCYSISHPVLQTLQHLGATAFAVSHPPLRALQHLSATAPGGQAVADKMCAAALRCSIHNVRYSSFSRIAVAFVCATAVQECSPQHLLEKSAGCPPSPERGAVAFIQCHFGCCSTLS